MKRLLCLAFAALALGACSGGDGRLSKSQYQAKLHGAFVAAQAADTATHQGGSDQVTVLKDVATIYSLLAATLKRAHPPVNVQALNDQLVAGALEQAKALNDLVAKLQQTSQAARYRVLAEFNANEIPGQKLFDGAVAALEAKGYKFKPSGGT